MKQSFFEKMGEIALAQEYTSGGSIGLMLIEVDESEQDADQTLTRDQLRDVIEEGLLRDSDRIYNLGTMRLLAVLGSTSEAGGEMAALRLKRSLMKRLQDRGVESSGIKTSVRAIPPGARVNLDELWSDLELGLEIKQVPDDVEVGPKPRREGPRAYLGTILLLKTDESEGPLDMRLLGECNLRYEELKADKFAEDEFTALLGQEPTVVLLPAEMTEIEANAIIKKIRNNRQFDHIAIVWIQNGQLDRSDYKDLIDFFIDDSSGASRISAMILAACVLSANKLTRNKKVTFAYTHEALGVTLHRLNQPLQVALGNCEALIMLRGSDPEALPLLNEIRTQILRASEIGQKLYRMVKES